MKRYVSLFLAICFMLSGMLYGAEKDTTLPEPGSKEWLEGQTRLAEVASQKGYWDEALYRWKQVIRFFPENGEAWNNLGIAFEAIGKWDEARYCYRVAIRLSPDNEYIRANYLRFLDLYKKYGKHPEQKKEKNNQKKKNEHPDTSSKEKERN